MNTENRENLIMLELSESVWSAMVKYVRIIVLFHISNLIAPIEHD
jgi:hypothetical protein